MQCTTKIDSKTFAEKIWTLTGTKVFQNYSMETDGDVFSLLVERERESIKTVECWRCFIGKKIQDL